MLVCICKPQTSLTGYNVIARSMSIPKASIVIHRCSCDLVSASRRDHSWRRLIPTVAGCCPHGSATCWRRPTTNTETILKAAHTHARIFGSDVCLVEADNRRKNKQTLSLLKNKARVYKISEAKIN